MTPTRITRDDALNAILETNEKLAQVSVGLGRLEERFTAMDTAHRERNNAQDVAIQEKLDAIHTELSAITDYETSCPIHVLKDEVEDLKRYHEDYPTMMWLFKKRTKVSLMWTVFGVSLLILTIAPWADRRVIGALLKFAGIPDPIVDIIVGKP
jgi:hypothetical protein